MISMVRTPPQWFLPTIEEIVGLLSLEPGWDSYGSPPINPHLVVAVIDLIFDTMQDNTPGPSVVPTSRGGIQLEWHIRGIDLEIEIISPYRLHLVLDDPRTGQSMDTEITQDLSLLIEAISSIAHPEQDTSDGEG